MKRKWWIYEGLKLTVHIWWLIYNIVNDLALYSIKKAELTNLSHTQSCLLLIILLSHNKKNMAMPFSSHFVCFEWLQRHRGESIALECLNVLPYPEQIPVHPIYFPADLLDISGWIPPLDSPVKMYLLIEKRSTICVCVCVCNLYDWCLTYQHISARTPRSIVLLV